MSAEVDSLIQRITEELREVPGVIGIVLGVQSQRNRQTGFRYRYRHLLR